MARCGRRWCQVFRRRGAAQIEAGLEWDPTLGANHAGASGLTQFRRH